MARLNVNPTRMELKKLKARLQTATRGHKLLKDKSDEMIRRFTALIKENKRMRAELEAELSDCLGKFATACAYFFLRSQSEAVRMYSSLIIGMSIAVAIYFIFPNGLGNLRPAEFPRENACTKLVRFLYKADTSTNVLPSLHVYNTLVVLVAVFHSKTFGRYHTAVKVITSVIGALICASTLFLKQHSVYDVIAAVIMAGALYPLIYRSKLFARLN